MALIKRIMEVIKEELFDNKSKTKKGEKNGYYYSERYGSVNNSKSAPKAEKKEQVTQKQRPASVKPSSPAKKTTGNRPQGNKQKVQKKQAVKSVRLPVETQKIYKDAQKFARNGELDKAFEIYKKTFRHVLSFACEELKIGYADKSLKWMVKRVCEELKATNKQSTKIHLLLSTFQETTEYKDAQSRIEAVRVNMNLFVNFVLIGFNAEQNKNKGKASAKNQPKANNLSFKARERGNKGEAFDVNKRYPKIKLHLGNAKLRNGEQNYESALYEIRMALEVVVKELGRNLSVHFEERESLEDKINKLGTAGRLSQTQTELLHSARRSGNKGSHDKSWTPGKSDVSKGFDEIKKVIEMFKTYMEKGETTENAPLSGTNEYYSTKRKYNGRWAKCFTYGELMMIEDFVRLKEKADNGDIQAMIDIASGFLENPICWTNESLICLKCYKNNPDPCDARYYYWILRACEAAYVAWRAGKDLPLRYLANVLLEGVKFIYWHRLRYKNVNRSVTQQDQFAGVEKNLFGKFVGLHNQENYLNMLVVMMKEYKPSNLFAPVHKETTVEQIQALKC